MLWKLSYPFVVRLISMSESAQMWGGNTGDQSMQVLTMQLAKVTDLLLSGAYANILSNVISMSEVLTLADLDKILIKPICRPM